MVGKIALLGIFFVIFLNTTFAAKRSGTTTANVAPTSCGTLLVESDTPLSEFEAAYQVHTLSDLVASSPDRNLAYRHPLMMMNAYQKAWAYIKKYGSRQILDPDYRFEKLTVWNALADVPVNGVIILGQEQGIHKIVSFLREGASGASRAKVIAMKGPAGVGKTEVLKKLHLIRATLGLTDPDFFEHRFRWVQLHTIPSLQPLQSPSQQNRPFAHQMGRSPIVLLPKAMQQRLIELTTPAVERMTGFAPEPFLIQDPQTKEILEHIMLHEFPDRVPTESQYFRALSKYVEIYRHTVDPDQPPIFIRQQGRDVEWSNLFMSEDPARKLEYGVKSALSYDYAGLILQADGFGFFGDEFWRQIVSFRDSMLEVAQNRVVQRGGAPAVFLDSFMLLADNDESIQRALEESASAAQLDRAASVNMRMPIHPIRIAQTALLMAMQEWGHKKFWMRDLTTEKRTPVDLYALFPSPREDGKLIGIDGRYALWCRLGSGKEILIAPRTLYYLGLTVAATRLVTDPVKLAKHLKEFDFLKSGSNEYTNSVTRLQIILDQLPASDAIRSELTKVRNLLEEGSQGISARSAQSWLLTALNMAEENHNTLTPALLDKAYEKMMDSKEFLSKNDDVRAKWVDLNEQVKAGLLLAALTEDVLRLLSSKTDINALYVEIESEIITLHRDPYARQFEGPGINNTVDINFERLDQVKRIYKELIGRSLEPGIVANFRLQHAQNPEHRDPELINTIKHWLYEKEINATVLDQFLRYFDKGDGNSDIRQKAERARQEMLSQGYNERALLEALSMARDIMRVKKQTSRKQQ